VIDSSFRSHHDSKKGQKRALDHDEIMVPGAGCWRKNSRHKYEGPTRSEVLRKLQGRVYFEKTVTESSASGYSDKYSKLVSVGWDQSIDLFKE
jgi:hypothetical protein